MLSSEIVKGRSGEMAALSDVDAVGAGGDMGADDSGSHGVRGSSRSKYSYY